MNKMCRLGLMALISVAGATAARAETVTIPYSAALPRYVAGENCIDGTLSWSSDNQPCLLRFPLTVPAGHNIQQILVLHTTNSLFPGTPSIQAWVEKVSINPAVESGAFLWSSSAYVPDGTIDSHPLMSTLKGFPDQFAVSSNVIYQVVVDMFNGAGLYGIQVIYN